MTATSTRTATSWLHELAFGFGPGCAQPKTQLQALFGKKRNRATARNFRGFSGATGATRVVAPVDPGENTGKLDEYYRNTVQNFKHIYPTERLFCLNITPVLT